MDYQKIKTQQDFSNSIVKEGDLLTFFTKDQNGKISIICKDSTGQFKTISGNDGESSEKLNQIYEILSQANYNVNYQFTINDSNTTKVTVTKEQLGVQSNIQFDVIDSQGYNITTDTRLTRRWNQNTYELTMSGGWAPGTYTLKTSNGNPWLINDVVDDTSTEVTLKPNANTNYRYTQPLTRLQLTQISNDAGETVIYFKTDENTCEIIFPTTGVKFFGCLPTFNVNTQYMLVIRYGVVAVGIVYTPTTSI